MFDGPQPKPITAPITMGFKVTRAERDAIERTAAQRRVKMSAVIRAALREHLGIEETRRCGAS